MNQLNEYKTFTCLGKHGISLRGYRKIKVHLVYRIKHDTRYNAICASDGHLTEIPIDSVYSGLVSLRGLHTMIYLAKLNDLDTLTTFIGSSYLEAYRSDQVYIIAGS